MRAYELRGEGLGALAVTERPSPRPGPGQVLVQMRAASLNYRDLLVLGGCYWPGPAKCPLIPLSDGAGEVVELGPGVTALAPGDRVAGAFFQTWINGPFDSDNSAMALGGTIDGVLAEQVVLEAAGALKIPEFLSFEEAATLPCAGVTAWVALVVQGQLRPGETLLVMGTGGVSILALQLAKSLGARVILTSSQDRKLTQARALGADALINYKDTPDWDLSARELTHGRGVDQLVEVGGAGTLPTSIRATREGGHISLVGLLSGAPADRESALRNDRGVRVDSVTVGSVTHFEAMNAHIARVRLHPHIDRTFAFDEAKGAYAYLSSRSHVGKVVIRF
jgi:NADPH:quinone reductase-like Zn-dependent oxidoreductase